MGTRGHYTPLVFRGYVVHLDAQEFRRYRGRTLVERVPFSSNKGKGNLRQVFREYDGRGKPRRPVHPVLFLLTALAGILLSLLLIAVGLR